jgi:hypothetical protein
LPAGVPRSIPSFRLTNEIASALSSSGHPVEMLVESRIGYVAHDDAFQVVAEPFSDTQTE